ncbi:MAG: MFS transporter, partial [Coxiellaceae bacterium]|nr:MFS transporter [Coxiellaceae bacterium]
MAKQQAELNSKITNTQRQSFIGAAIGTLIEYYDYALFALFLPIIAPQFFPGDTAYDSLYHGYQILMIAMIARPFGGAIFGHIGDFIGRRHALLLSMYGIAVTTLIIGLTPTYHSIGVFAIMIIVIAKAIQIACFGGEYNGAGIYVVEHAKQHQEGLVGSLLTAIISTGSLIASLLGILLTMDGMPDWSWRIAFFLGGLIGVFGVLYRKKMVEPANFKPAQRSVHNL